VKYDVIYTRPGSRDQPPHVDTLRRSADTGWNASKEWSVIVAVTERWLQFCLDSVWYLFKLAPGDCVVFSSHYICHRGLAAEVKDSYGVFFSFGSRQTQSVFQCPSGKSSHPQAPRFHAEPLSDASSRVSLRA
jgi:hypothetical protein